MTPSRRGLALGALITVAAAPAMGAERAHGPDPAALKAAIDSLAERSRSLAARAASADAFSALRRLPPDPGNGFSFRFDERLEEARVVADPAPPTRAILAIDLTRASAPFAVRGGQARPEPGRFAVAAGSSTVIETSVPFDVAVASAGILSFRLTVHRNQRVNLGWSLDGGRIDWEDWQYFMNLEVIADGRPHDYRVPIADRLRGWHEGKRLRKLAMAFPLPDDVSLERFALLDEDEPYETAVGLGRERIAAETRAVLYMRSAATATYTLDLPASEAFLSVGLGSRRGASSFRIVLRSDGVETELFSGRAQPFAWSDPPPIPLGRWRGRKVAVRFEARPDRGAVAFWSNPRLYSTPSRRLNVLLVFQDALRADHLSAYGYRRDTSPFQAVFARRGALFERAFSQGTVTVSSYASWLTSLFPSSTRVRFLTDRLNSRFLTLPEILRADGFETVSLIENIDAGLLGGLDQGYDRLAMNDPAGTPALLGRAAELLERSPTNVFLNVHLMAPHGPYDPPPAYRGWYRAPARSDGRIEPLVSWLDPPWVSRPTVAGRRALYDGEIRRNDDLLRVFFERLQRSGVLGHTIVVLTSDHGEYLGEDGRWQHGPPANVQVARVPLILVYPPAVPAGRRVRSCVQHIDIAPTVLKLVGIPTDGLLLQGRSLLPLPRESSQLPCYTDGLWEQHRSLMHERHPYASLIVGRWHVLRTLGEPANNEHALAVYDQYADPEERRNLASGGSLASILDAPLERLQRSDARLWESVSRSSREENAFSQDELKELRRMGYLQDTETAR